MKMMTETDIVVATGMSQATVHRHLVKNLATMRYEQITKRVKLYDVRTLPDVIKTKIHEL